MKLPHDRSYSEHHLWVKLDGTEAVIGLSGYAKEELGEVDYIEVVQPGQSMAKGEPFGIVETSKAVTDLIAPISGTVRHTNNDLFDSPATLMNDPYGAGWLVRVEPTSPVELQDLLKPDEYERLLTAAEPEAGN